MTGNGVEDLVIAPDPDGPQVKVIDVRTGTQVTDFFVYEPGFTGGQSVAAGDVNRDGFGDILTGRRAGRPGGGRPRRPGVAAAAER